MEPPTCLGLYALGAAGETIFDLLFGWFSFLARVLPRTTYEPAALIVAGSALVLFTIGLHFVARKLSRQTCPEKGEPSVRWKWRSTLTTVAGLFVLFTAGISLVGITHQAVWLYTADQPLTIEGSAIPGGPHKTRLNMQEIGLGFQNYHSTFRRLPKGPPFNESGRAMHSWETHILPYLWINRQGITLNLPWRHPKHNAIFQSELPVFLNPRLRSAPARNEEGYGLSHFAANSGVMAPGTVDKLDEITDGTSNTILFGEVNTGFRAWGDPINWRDPADGLASRPRNFSGPYPHGTTIFCMADGSVSVLSSKTDPKVLKALATPAAGDHP